MPTKVNSFCASAAKATISNTLCLQKFIQSFNITSNKSELFKLIRVRKSMSALVSYKKPASYCSENDQRNL